MEIGHMPQTIRLSRKADQPVLVTLPDGTEWLMPSLADIIALPADAIGTGKIGAESGGLEALSIAQTFKLVDVDSFDGRPVMVTATVSFKRTAITEAEAARVDKAVKAQADKSHASKLAKAQERTELIQASVATFREGIAARAAEEKPTQPVNVAEHIRQAFEMVNTIQAVVRPSLPAGQ